jgi:hypothetical protein
VCRDHSFLRGLAGARATQAVAGEVDAVGIVDDAIENSVGVGRIADEIVPFVDRDLAGDDGRSPAVALFENLEEVVARGGVERCEPPVVEDEQLHATEGAQDMGIAAIAAREREIGKQVARPSSVNAGRSASCLTRPLITKRSIVRLVIFVLGGPVPLATQNSRMRSGTVSASRAAASVGVLTMVPHDQGRGGHESICPAR